MLKEGVRAMPENIYAPLRAEPITAANASLAPTAAATLAGDMNSRFAAARPRLARLARLNGVSADQAEDIAQETLLTAWRSLDYLRDASRFDAWLDGICRNLCRRAARQSASERARLALDSTTDGTAELDDANIAADADPLDELSRRELVALVESALGHLNLAAREAVSLRYLADLPADETAACLGLSVNTLEARLSRARKQLRDALNGPLREQAVAFGLALAPADEAGWRDTSIWCHFCGKARMQGMLADTPDGSGGSLALRCPLCYREYGVTETSIPTMPALAGATSFRPALKRVLEHAVAWNAATERLETICFSCGRPLPARMGRFDDFPQRRGMWPAVAELYSAVYECAQCDSFGSGSAALAGRSHPAVWRFLTERQRWVIEPDQRVTFQSAPAIRFTLYDPGAGERITFFSDPDTLAVRGVIEP
jgi:RNA polymerase sigma-70 factor (ECF subfamily)